MTSGAIRTVLVIDDDPDVLALAGFALSDLGGLTTVLCNDDKAALAEIERSIPDAILLDLVLPGSSGLMILEALRANPITADIPVVIATALSDSVELKAIGELPISGVIRKPFEPETLAERLRVLCTRTANYMAGSDSGSERSR